MPGTLKYAYVTPVLLDAMWEDTGLTGWLHLVVC
jgi:hypothetical protein